MSRSGYIEGLDTWALIRYRGAVASATRGARGQGMLISLRSALDAMQCKRLIAHELHCDGEYCALGALAEAKHIAVDDLDPEDSEEIAKRFGVAEALARETVFENDECGRYNETPYQRWVRMRAWTDANILSPNA